MTASNFKHTCEKCKQVSVITIPEGAPDVHCFYCFFPVPRINVAMAKIANSFKEGSVPLEVAVQNVQEEFHES